MQDNFSPTLSYKIKHSYDINSFLLSHHSMLQKAIHAIRSNTEWVKKREKRHYAVDERRMGYYHRRLTPVIPKSKEFRRQLREELLESWEYAAHYVDSAVKAAYSTLKRRNYVEGRRNIVKRLFIRVKEALYACRDGGIRVT